MLPGSYKIVLEYGDRKLEKEIAVKKEKNLDYPGDEWKKNYETVLLLGDFMSRGIKSWVV